MAAKYYVVKAGRKSGIYRSWDACKQQVDGFSGAIYKSFKSENEAQAFLGTDKSVPDVVNDELCDESTGVEDKDRLIAYVDGSFYAATGEFSYGMVILRDGEELCFGAKVDDKQLAMMHNVAGEIKGAEAAMRYAVAEGFNKLTIYHDYEGIARWCRGEWKTNKEGTKAYKAFYDSIKDTLDVEFIKVKGHSNDKYNDMADMLAKKALGL